MKKVMIATALAALLTCILMPTAVYAAELPEVKVSPDIMAKVEAGELWPVLLKTESGYLMSGAYEWQEVPNGSPALIAASLYWDQAKEKLKSEYRVCHPFGDHVKVVEAKAHYKQEQITPADTAAKLDALTKAEKVKEKEQELAELKANNKTTQAEIKEAEEALKAAHQEADAAAKLAKDKTETVTVEKPVNVCVVDVERKLFDLHIEHTIMEDGKPVQVLTDEKSLLIGTKVVPEDYAIRGYKLISEKTVYKDGQTFSTAKWDTVQKDAKLELYYEASTEKVALEPENNSPKPEASVAAKQLPSTGVAETLPIGAALALIAAGFFVAVKH